MQRSFKIARSKRGAGDILCQLQRNTDIKEALEILFHAKMQLNKRVEDNRRPE